MTTIQMITPCLWYDTQAEEAANFYVSIFENSRVIRTLRYGQAGHEIHGKPAGSVLTVEFELNGQRFTALNGGPQFKFNEAISLEVTCETQQEIDTYWDRLCEGGEPGSCGWLKDKFGLSWQVTPAVLGEMLADPDEGKTERVMEAFLQMKKLDIAAIKRAYAGK
jgi:predicted 3-demethylubiquinone-9 3-methyltransferase (glyoxalase superfamily)